MRGLRWRRGLAGAEFEERGVETVVAGATDFILGRVRMGVEWLACESRFAAMVRQFNSEVRDGEPGSVGGVFVSGGVGRQQDRDAACESREAGHKRGDISRGQ